MASKSKIFSLLLVLLLSFSHHCLAHHCTCQCDMTSNKKDSGSGSSNTGFSSGSSNSGSSNTGPSSSSGSSDSSISGSFGSGPSNTGPSSSSGSSDSSIPGSSGSSDSSTSGSFGSGPSNTGSSSSSGSSDSSISGSSGSSDSSNSGNFGSGSSNTGPSSSSGSSDSSISGSFGSGSSNSGYQQPGYKALDFGFKPCFKSIIAFGDSFTDTGNAPLSGGLKAFASAFMPGSPYGSSSSGQPATRFSDGRVLVDFLCEILHLPHLVPFQNKSADFSKGVNFAIGGSSAFPGDVFRNHDIGRALTWKTVPDCLTKQLDWFQEFLNNKHCDGLNAEQCKEKLGSSLFWVGEMGSSDYARNFGSFTSIQSLMEKLTEFKCNLVKTLLDKGAKYIVVQGLPPLGCLPLHMTTATSRDKDEHGCSSGLNSIVKQHNDLLCKKLDELRAQFPDCFVSYGDFWNAFLTILKNPSQFGFSETFKVCCGSGSGPFNFNVKSICGSPDSAKCKNPANHMIWDGLHPTEAMYGKLADLFFNKDFCKPPFKLLLNAAGKAIVH